MANVSLNELMPLYSYKKPYIYFKNRQLPSLSSKYEICIIVNVFNPNTLLNPQFNSVSWAIYWTI